MAPTKPKKKSQKDKARDRLRAKASSSQSSNVQPRELLAQAAAFLEEGDPESAAPIARKAYEHIGAHGRHACAALSLLGQIHVELGDIDSARDFFAAAVKLDEDGSLPEGVGGGPEKFLWLAQLSEEGGQDSVAWYERGATALRSQIRALTESLESRPLTRDQQEAVIAEKRRKLAEVLCAVVEVYMTDLSWDEDAEDRCEACITEATMIAPESAETWQTVANVRISQERMPEAREALKRSLALWWDLPPEDPAVPPFPSRVSLVRLLIEVEMEDEAMEVTERMIGEDDRSVEVLYLGGYARFRSGERLKNSDQAPDPEVWKRKWRSSRKWLVRCLRIFQEEEYEDTRLGEHAQELLAILADNKSELGESLEDAEDEDAWEDTDDEEDEEGVDDDEDTEMQ
ncbi:hypothetical protein N656DRAFT_7179 [Canariomyces notabilis]|uniref:TPR domain-containing protein n=1 Tax=Canariomyces notabilis TaxID=2074819 RepID=A0AAN6YXD5_9PEZI|nr:hypothetical protein N656DRAFT_7179 [Canariomyces arenarius]